MRGQLGPLALAITLIGGACADDCSSKACLWQVSLRLDPAVRDRALRVCIGNNCADFSEGDMASDSSTLFLTDGTRTSIGSDYPAFPDSDLVLRDGQVTTGVLGSTTVSVSVDGARAVSSRIELPDQQCGNGCGAVTLAYDNRNDTISTVSILP